MTTTAKPGNLEHLKTIFSNINLTSHQEKYLTNFIHNYIQKTKKSQEIAQANRLILADNKSLVQFKLPLKELYYPLVTKQSYGSKIQDINNNEYIDLVMGYGVNLLGHNPPFIKQAIVEQLDRGIQLGSQPELIGEVANLIRELTGVERVAFSNTGTEAVMTAIRLARSCTKRKKIAIFTNSYHGHADGVLAYSLDLKLPNILEKLGGNILTSRINSLAFPASYGIPYSATKNILMLEYGNPQSLNIIKANRGKLAAVLVEPVQTNNLALQPQEFLHQLRQLTQRSEIALIFDEMVTGFRIHPGGAQAWFEIEADIVTYGKVVGGGLPIGIIAGKAQYLDAIDGGMWNYGDLSVPQTERTIFAGTYCKHPLAIAAAKATLEYLKAQGATLQEELNIRTSKFVNTLNHYFEQEQLPIYLTNFGSVFAPTNRKDDSTRDSANQFKLSLFLDLLFYHLIVKGIMPRGHRGFLSTAHTEADLDCIIQAIKDSISELRQGEFLP
ncbi:MAG: aspartate aminotransferase family protein [Cyanobacteria bacterium P01_H01_bin.35]